MTAAYQEDVTPPLLDSWLCRWCRSRSGTVILDLGRQSAADHFPMPSDPGPDPTYPLRMVCCADCSLAQLESDATTADEPRGVEPQVLRQQARAAVDTCFADGFAQAGTTVAEFGSPHSGSWLPLFTERGACAATASPADVVIDSFGMMHAADQAQAMQDRVSRMAPDGTLVLQFHSMAAIMRNSSWSALRHGHFAYYSTPGLVLMAASHGLVAVAAHEYPLYGGTVLIAFRQGAQQGSSVAAIIEAEVSAGVLEPTALRELHRDMQGSAAQLAAYIARSVAGGLTLGGYGAASRAVSLLQVAIPDRPALSVVADLSPAKQGRCLPGQRVPIVSPHILAANPPDRVLLFVPDLLDEVRNALPEVEAAGGRWVVVEPTVREVPPISATGEGHWITSAHQPADFPARQS